jgi:hypothetical protein
LAPCRLDAGRLSWLQRAGPSATLDKHSSVVGGIMAQDAEASTGVRSVGWAGFAERRPIVSAPSRTGSRCRVSVRSGGGPRPPARIAATRTPGTKGRPRMSLSPPMAESATPSVWSSIQAARRLIRAAAARLLAARTRRANGIRHTNNPGGTERRPNDVLPPFRHWRVKSHREGKHRRIEMPP